MIYFTYIGLAVGVPLVVLAVAYGMSKISSTALESIARQPEAAEKIQQAMGLPLFLLESVAVVSLLVFFMIVFKQ